jgi:hypothetical protein
LCAKEAAAKATRLASSTTRLDFEITELDESSGTLLVTLGGSLAGARPEWMPDSLRVVSARRGDYAWAWTFLEGADL